MAKYARWEASHHHQIPRANKRKGEAQSLHTAFAVFFSYDGGIIILPGEVSLDQVLLAKDDQIRELCGQLCMCKDDVQCVQLIAQLRLLLHEHIENLQGKVTALAPIADRRSEIEKAS